MCFLISINKFFKSFIDELSKKEILTLSSSLSFYTAFSITPLILIILYLLGLFGEHAQHYFLTEVGSLLGEHAKNSLFNFIEIAKAESKLSKMGGVLGLLVLLFSSTGVFSELHFSMNKIWDTKYEDRSNLILWLRRKILSFSFILALVFLSIISLLASTFINYFIVLNKGFLSFINNFSSILVFTFLFTCLIKFIPDRNVSLKSSFIGGIVTALLYTLGKYLITLYLTYSSISTIYGGAQTLMIFLIWVYYSSLIVFCGAIFAKVVEDLNT